MVALSPFLTTGRRPVIGITRAPTTHRGGTLSATSGSDVGAVFEIDAAPQMPTAR